MNMSKAEKAKMLMYKKPALANMDYQSIIHDLETISEECWDVSYLDDDTILSVIDDNEELLEEYKAMFLDLSQKCDILLGELNGYNSPEDYFNDCTVALIGNRYNLIGYDAYEEDYYSLTSYDAKIAFSEAGKRIMRNTKQDMLSKIGHCLGSLLAYWNIRQDYDNLEAIFQYLKGSDNETGKAIKRLNELYDGVMEDNENDDREFKQLLDYLPDKVWLQ